MLQSYSSIGSHLLTRISAEIPFHSQSSWKRICECRNWQLEVVEFHSCLPACFFTWSSSGFELLSERCCCSHRIFPSVEIPQSCHPSTQCNLTGFLGNLYPWWWRRCWEMFHWAERWGRHSLPILDRHLGMKVRTGFHLHLSRFHHMLWTTLMYCTRFEILVLFYCHQSGIWDEFNRRSEFLFM